MTTVLITGATGFVGTRLCRNLLDDHRVAKLYALVHQSDPPSSFSANCSQKLHLIRGDLLSPMDMQEAVRDVQIVIHLAALMDFHPSNPSRVMTINVEGTRNLLEACKKSAQHLTRFVFISSQEAMGPSPNDQPADEQTPPAPTFVYGKSKLLAENLVRESGLPFVIVRLTGLIGPAESYSTFEMMKLIDMGLMIAYPGKSDKRTSFAHVDDGVQGIILAAFHERAIGQTYIIGPPDAQSYKEFIDTICDSLHRPRPFMHIPISVFKMGAFLLMPFVNCIRWISSRGQSRRSFLLHPSSCTAMEQNRVFSIDKARQELGYVPRFSMREAAQLTVQHWIENGVFHIHKADRSRQSCFLIVMLFSSIIGAIIIMIQQCK